MNYKILILLFFITIVSSAKALSIDTIHPVSKILSIYTCNGENIKERNILKMLRTDSAAKKECRKAIFNEVLYGIFVFPGGLVLTGSSKTANINSNGSVSVNPFAVAGIGCLGIGMYFYTNYRKHMLRAIRIYNENLVAKFK